MTNPLIQLDKNRVWHPYSSMTNPLQPCLVTHADGIELTLDSGQKLIDGMSSWWSAIHGYNHPALNNAIKTQTDSFAHVMFGGLTHEPAIRLCDLLARITPDGLEKVFLSDSGSVAVEVAMKMALQYWQGKNQSSKTAFVTLRGGYHGDTLGAMSVCDPVTGMHSLFSNVLAKQHFIQKPDCRFKDKADAEDLAELKTLLDTKKHEIAALILEPVVQGAGGMYFYSPDYLSQASKLCKKHNVLLIADEIATGFGRTGKLFACEHADIAPDILCLGKAMTGGYLTLAATLCTEEIASGIDNSASGAFMHGPTFMGNALACSVALASIELLLSGNWQQKIQMIEKVICEQLAPANDIKGVREVRTLGAIGVIELEQPVDMRVIQPAFVEAGIWIRPFGNLVYTMPPFIIGEKSLEYLCSQMVAVTRSYLEQN